MKVQLFCRPQLTIATAIVMCHRFYFHQSHAKNDRRTIATVCMFFDGKVGEIPRLLKDVIVISHSILHKKDPAAIQKIKQKVLCLIGDVSFLHDTNGLAILNQRDATTMGLYKAGPTYPFGVDPVWHSSRSELQFLNSLKIKMSILLGVAQMNLGIILSYFNGKFFQNNLNIWYQFLPKLIFLNNLFGYLSLLIIVKWCTGSQADLYHVLIYMFLSPTDDIGENQLFPGQKTLQLVLLFLAFVSVPWMLLPKPFLLKKQHQEVGYSIRFDEEIANLKFGGEVEDVNGLEQFQELTALPGTWWCQVWVRACY